MPEDELVRDDDPADDDVRDDDLHDDEGPAETPSDVSEETDLPGAENLRPDVRNGDLTADQASPAVIAPTSDPSPDDADADFPGVPLSDAEIDALPVEELDP